MKKKIVAVLVAFCVAISIVGCAPKGMDKNSFALGKEAVTVAEQFTSGTITTSDAVSKLESIYERLGNVREGNISTEERGRNLEIQYCITDLSFAIEYGDVTGDSITEAIVALKALLQ